MGAHSPIPISAAGQWIHCPGSCQMQARYPQEGSKSALEGEAAHDCAARMLRGETVKAGDFAENLQIITDEMYSAALLYYRDVMDVTGGEGLTIEQRVHAPHISPYLYGTPDCWAIVDDTLMIWDFKFGYLPVEAYGNWQGLGYACCIIPLIYGTESAVDIHKIQIRIVQPRANHHGGPVRTWSFSAGNIQGYEQRIKEAINKALSPTATTRSGLWCHYCSAITACPASQKHGAAIMEYVDRATPKEPDPATIAMELSLLTEAAKMIEYRKKALEGLATARIKAGELIPGYGITPTMSRLSWTVDPAVAAAVADTQGVDIRKPVDVLTPTQAKSKGMNVDKLAAKKQTGHKLVKIEPLKIFAED